MLATERARWRVEVGVIGVCEAVARGVDAGSDRLRMAMASEVREDDEAAEEEGEEVEEEVAEEVAVIGAGRVYVVGDSGARGTRAGGRIRCDDDDDGTVGEVGTQPKRIGSAAFFGLEGTEEARRRRGATSRAFECATEGGATGGDACIAQWWTPPGGSYAGGSVRGDGGAEVVARVVVGVVDGEGVRSRPAARRRRRRPRRRPVCVRGFESGAVVVAWGAGGMLASLTVLSVGPGASAAYAARGRASGGAFGSPGAAEVVTSNSEFRSGDATTSTTPGCCP
jgi:hypothetical protein